MAGIFFLDSGTIIQYTHDLNEEVFQCPQTIPINNLTLVHEKSPYLLQHAYNTVHWVPWGDAAFAKAATEDKPVFLSIGYSTCH
jgi:hypothetical protein